jgi:subfamily B ATP-binding cassette protein MsbA
MKIFKRIISYAKPYGAFAMPYFLFALLSTLFGLLNFIFIMPILEMLFGTSKQIDDIQLLEPGLNINYFKSLLDYYSAYLIKEYGKSNALIFIALFLSSTSLLTNLFKYLTLNVNARIRATLIYNIRKALFEKVISLDVGYFTNQRKGDLMSRLTNDLNEIENSVVGSLQIFFRDPFVLTIYIFTLFMINWELMLYTLLILPLAGLLISVIGKKLKRQSMESQQSMGMILSTIDEAISGIRIIKGFVAEQFTNSRFNSINNHFTVLNKKMSYKRELASPLTEFLGVSIASLILYIGGNNVFEGSLEPGLFFLFILSFYRILEPVKSIASSLTSIQRGIAAGERVFQLIDEPIAIQENSNAITTCTFEKEIKLNKVFFNYDERVVLNNISLTIPKGKIVALVGPSGGGKSTLVDLIPRFQDPKAGNITIDDIDTKDLAIHALRNKIGIVTQESILFNDTIFNNIAFGQSQYSMEDVIHAAKVAHAHEFILQTEDGYNTIIGERGMKLSGGQRQRLSIARAVLKNPEILILDEATSALDNESEKLVQEALNTLMHDRTAVVIAHRLSTIRHADKIVVLDKGNIVEEGTHNELMEKQGMYFKLHQHANGDLINL